MTRVGPRFRDALDYAATLHELAGLPTSKR